MGVGCESDIRPVLLAAGFAMRVGRWTVVNTRTLWFLAVAFMVAVAVTVTVTVALVVALTSTGQRAQTTQTQTAKPTTPSASYMEGYNAVLTDTLHPGRQRADMGRRYWRWHLENQGIPNVLTIEQTCGLYFTDPEYFSSGQPAANRPDFIEGCTDEIHYLAGE